MKNNQSGSINILLIPLILTIVFLLATSGFAIWAFGSRQDYKNNTDEKIATAVEVAVEEAKTTKDNEFIEKEKEPLKSYRSAAQFGSLSLQYPKTWSAYVNEKGQGTTEFDGYFHPNVVPGAETDPSYATRIQLSTRNFNEEVRTFDSAIKTGKAQAQPYQPTNQPSVVGLRIEGEISPKKQGTLILIPLRDKTIKVFSESSDFKKDFETIILAKFNFSP